jgi:hypothetical protein
MIVAKITPRLLAAALVVPLALATPSVMAGPVGLIDDFDTPGLTEYNFYKVLDQNAGTTNISFSDASGSISALSTGTTGAEQVLFFRNDGATLGPGEELQIDGPSAESGSGTEDLGLAVGETPTSLGDPAAGSTRNLADFLFITYRNPTQLNSRGFNGGAEIGQVQSFGVTANKLFIARLANDDMELGYYDGTNTRQVVRTVTPVTTDIYNNVGFYSDLRGDGATIGALDNLRIVPEPGCLMLAMFAFVGLIGLHHRRC